MSTPLVLVATHAGTAVLCLGLGGYTLLRRHKGDVVHRLVGWSWVAGMTYVATSSFAIRDLRDGRFSVLHVLSLVTASALVLGIRAARRHDRQAHRGHMLGSYLGLAGAFIGAVAVPDRLVPTFVVTRPAGALTALAVLGALFAVIVGGSHLWAHLDRDRLTRPRGPRVMSGPLAPTGHTPLGPVGMSAQTGSDIRSSHEKRE